MMKTAKENPRKLNQNLLKSIQTAFIKKSKKK